MNVSSVVVRVSAFPRDFWYIFLVANLFSYRICNNTRCSTAFVICIIKLSGQLLTCIYSCVCSLFHTFGIIVADVFILCLRCFITRLRRKMSFTKQTTEFSVSLMPFSLCVPTLQMFLFKDFEQPTH